MLTFIQDEVNKGSCKHIKPLVDGKPIIINNKQQEGWFDNMKEVNIYKEFWIDYYEGYNPNNIIKLMYHRNGIANKTWKLFER